MRIVYSKFLPFKGFRAINLFGIVFARSEQPTLDARIINHEQIHTRQIIETVVVFFYVWYIVEWLIRWAIYKDRDKAYRNIGFEREAFCNDNNPDYLKTRKRFEFVSYIITKR